MFENQVNDELSFYAYINGNKHGEYNYLIGHSITTFRNLDTWKNEIMPYLVSLQNGLGNINDWHSFPWGGIICFRIDYVMIIDKSIEKVGIRLPGLKNQEGENLQNGEGEWILDTNYIEENYTEFVKISINDYIQYCTRWIEILSSQMEV